MIESAEKCLMALIWRSNKLQWEHKAAIIMRSFNENIADSVPSTLSFLGWARSILMIFKKDFNYNLALKQMQKRVKFVFEQDDEIIIVDS